MSFFEALMILSIPIGLATWVIWKVLSGLIDAIAYLLEIQMGDRTRSGKRRF